MSKTNQPHPLAEARMEVKWQEKLTSQCWRTYREMSRAAEALTAPYPMSVQRCITRAQEVYFAEAGRLDKLALALAAEEDAREGGAVQVTVFRPDGFAGRQVTTITRRRAIVQWDGTGYMRRECVTRLLGRPGGTFGEQFFYAMRPMCGGAK